MNQRILKLAVEAGLYVDLNGTPWPRAMSAEESELAYEKFAELIVLDCINIVKPTQHHEAFAQGYLGDVDGLELLDSKVKQIKQHFGVEL